MVSEADKKRKRVTFLKSTTYLSAITPSVDSVGCHPYLPRVDCSTHTGKSWTGGSRIFCIAHPVQNDDFYCSYSPPRVHLICTPLPCSCHPQRELISATMLLFHVSVVSQFFVRSFLFHTHVSNFSVTVCDVLDKKKKDNPFIGRTTGEKQKALQQKKRVIIKTQKTLHGVSKTRT